MEFVTKMAWPVIVSVVVFFARQPIGQWLQVRPSKLKILGIELEWATTEADAKLAAMAARVDALEAKLDDPPTIAPRDSGAAHEPDSEEPGDRGPDPLTPAAQRPTSRPEGQISDSTGGPLFVRYAHLAVSQSEHAMALATQALEDRLLLMLQDHGLTPQGGGPIKYADDAAAARLIGDSTAAMLVQMSRLRTLASLDGWDVGPKRAIEFLRLADAALAAIDSHSVP